jgi:hypothetical protein
MTTPAKPKPAATLATEQKTVATKKVASKTAAKVSPAKTAKPEKKVKPAKVKMVRDSFSMPETDYANLIALKKKCMSAGVKIKKSELIRAGLLSLVKLSDAALLKEVAKIAGPKE